MSPRRRRRTKWEDPISPLQAARFEKRWFQMDACRRLREICPGHGEGRPCRFEPSKLSDYERGKRWPSMKHVLALATLYGKTPAELGLLHRSDMPKPRSDETTVSNDAENSSKTNQSVSVYATPYGASESPEGGMPSGLLDDDVLTVLLLRVLLGDGGSDSVRRDTFVKGIGAAAGAAFVDPIAELSRRAQSEINLTRVSNEQVVRLAGAVYHHARDFYQLKDKERMARLLADWVSTQRLLHLPATHEQRTELLNIYARLCGILGNLASNRLEISRAWTLFETARDAARSSGDAELVGWVHGRMCELTYRYNDFDRAVELAQGGLTAVGASKSRTAAALHGWLARGYAGLGDEHATRTHLETAGRILSSTSGGPWPSTPNMPRAFTYREDGLHRTTAMAHLRLGHYSDALKHCDHADVVFRKIGWSMRTVTPVMGSRMTRAEILLRSGELDAATEIAIVALRAYNGVALPVQLRRARRFERELASRDIGGTYAQEFSEFLRSRAA